MADLTLHFKMKDFFFDREVVQRAVGVANAKALSRAGTFIRQRARSSIRRRKSVSAPGSPPHAHAKSEPNLKTILFAYEPARQSVVIGPVKLHGVKGLNVPSVLEHGGQQTLTRRRRKGVQVVQVRYQARPFMGPALEAEAPKFPELFRESL